MRALLDALRGARVAVYGDFALDAYWELDAGEEESSLETGLPVGCVVGERLSPGGAGNVAANLAALGVAAVRAVGPVGSDPWGRVLRAGLSARGVDVAGLAPPRAEWRTPVYAKPVCAGRERSRFDFGTRQTLGTRELDALFDALAAVAGDCDAVVVNQQLDPGACPAAMAQRLSELAEVRADTVFLVDSRHRCDAFRAMAVKASDVESAAARSEALGRPVFATRGAEGMLVAAGGSVTEVPAFPVDGPVDPVGAGDTTVAALAAALGVGADPVDAARLAAVAAAVTVGKHEETGTATRDEVLAALERVAPA